MHSNFRLCWFSLFVPACKSPRQIHFENLLSSQDESALDFCGEESSGGGEDCRGGAACTWMCQEDSKRLVNGL